MSFIDHPPNRQIGRPRADSRIIASDEQELVDPVRRGRQQVAAESEQVPISAVDAGHCRPAQRRNLLRHRNTGDRGPAEVVVRHQEPIDSPGEHCDLPAYAGQVGTGGRFDLAENLERRRLGRTAQRGGLESYALRAPHTDAFGQTCLLPSEASRITTESPGTECEMTVPGPAGESTGSPTAGVVALKS